MSARIYVVIADCGEYSGRTQTPVCAFADEGAADRAAERMTKELEAGRAAIRAQGLNPYLGEARCAAAPLAVRLGISPFDVTRNATMSFDVYPVPLDAWPDGGAP